MGSFVSRPSMGTKKEVISSSGFHSSGHSVSTRKTDKGNVLKDMLSILEEINSLEDKLALMEEEKKEIQVEIKELENKLDSLKDKVDDDTKKRLNKLLGYDKLDNILEEGKSFREANKIMNDAR